MCMRANFYFLLSFVKATWNMNSAGDESSVFILWSVDLFYESLCADTHMATNSYLNPAHMNNKEFLLRFSCSLWPPHLGERHGGASEVNQRWLCVCLMYPLALVPDAAVDSTPCCFGPPLQPQLFIVYVFLVFETRLRRCHRLDFKGTGTPPPRLDFDKCLSHVCLSICSFLLLLMQVGVAFVDWLVKRDWLDRKKEKKKSWEELRMGERGRKEV